MRRSRIAQRLALIVMSIGFTCLIAEFAIRLLGAYNPDGQFTFLGQPLPPYRPEVSRIEQELGYYLQHEAEARYHYHPALGWWPNPGYRSADGHYRFNSQALRADADFSQTPAPNTLRIAIFGDSFVLGDEVAGNETWGHMLEDLLRERGIRAEVLNFGVGGYGMDQAYLRWQIEGRQYAPDMVLFGFQPENIGRNLNVFRFLYPRGDGIPLTKPRFILETGGLALINSPTMSPDHLLTALPQLETQPLLTYEFFNPYASGAAQWWYSSRLVGLAANTLRLTAITPPLLLDGPPLDLALAIVAAFAADVGAQPAYFAIVELPYREILTSAPPGYPAIINRLADMYPLIRTAALFARAATGYWMSGGHYAPPANRLVAGTLADWIETCFHSGACRPDRFDQAALSLAR